MWGILGLNQVKVHFLDFYYVYNVYIYREKNMVGQANEMTLVLDGKSLYYTVLPDLRKDFIDLCTSCKAVVCCRVSPIQKAEMVELVNNNIF